VTSFSPKQVLKLSRIIPPMRYYLAGLGPIHKHRNAKDPVLIVEAFIDQPVEQDPILERHGDQVGVVIGGQGQRWFDVTLRGQDSHAGSKVLPW